jgi:metal-responsive CopG/Arc/MetJ family transcriptional regulator
VVNKLVECCGRSEKVKAVLRNKLLMRDKNLRKKTFKFGDVVEELISEKSKNEKAKEQNDKLLRMAGKETQMSGNDKLAWIAGKGATDQVTVINNIIRKFSQISFS